MSEAGWRLPAEWEAQTALLIAWPHAGTDWAARLGAVEEAYAVLGAAVSRRQALWLAVPDTATGERARSRVAEAGGDPARVQPFVLPYDDTWTRDYGPLSLIDDRGGRRWVDARFDGWGGRHDAADDDALTAGLAAALGMPAADYRRLDWVLEGGAIDVDGLGNCLTTAAYWAARHPAWSRFEVQRRLHETLGIARVCWLDHGHIEGDDTDGHIDTLARFVGPGTIAYQACDDTGDAHYAPLQAMAKELGSLRDGGGRPYALLPLPWPGVIRDRDGRRLPATYANFAIVNQAVLMPAYGIEADTEARARLQRAFPAREIVPIPSRALIWQNGSLHCLTMQLPAPIRAAS